MARIPRDRIKDAVKEVAKAESINDIYDVAKQFGVDLTEEQAQMVLRSRREEVELPLDFLETVAGGSAVEDHRNCAHGNNC